MRRRLHPQPILRDARLRRAHQDEVEQVAIAADPDGVTARACAEVSANRQSGRRQNGRTKAMQGKRNDISGASVAVIDRVTPSRRRLG